MLHSGACAESNLCIQLLQCHSRESYCIFPRDQWDGIRVIQDAANAIGFLRFVVSWLSITQLFYFALLVVGRIHNYFASIVPKSLNTQLSCFLLSLVSVRWFCHALFFFYHFGCVTMYSSPPSGLFDYWTSPRHRRRDRHSRAGLSPWGRTRAQRSLSLGARMPHLTQAAVGTRPAKILMHRTGHGVGKQ